MHKKFNKELTVINNCFEAVFKVLNQMAITWCPPLFIPTPPHPPSPDNYCTVPNRSEMGGNFKFLTQF